MQLSKFIDAGTTGSALEIHFHTATKNRHKSSNTEFEQLIWDLSNEDCD